jgi:hypothetical protein
LALTTLAFYKPVVHNMFTSLNDICILDNGHVRGHDLGHGEVGIHEL